MRKIFFILICILLFFTPVFSQESKTTSIQQTPYFGPQVDPEKYILGPGDSLRLYLIKEKEPPEIYDLLVSPTGSISLPMVGNIKVADLTLNNALKEITRQLIKFYPKSIISIDLINPRSYKVFISGEVANPGTYILSALSRLDDLIKMAGGLRSSASVRGIQIKRGNKIIEIDYLQFLKNGDLTQNPYIEDGDLVYVPLMKKSVKIIGQVKSPGIYEIREGEKLLDVINMAGSLTVNADLFGGVIERQKENKREIIEIDLFKLLFEKDEKVNIALQDGDTIIVPTKVNRIYVLGYVSKPQAFTLVTSEGMALGESDIREGAKISEFISRAGGILPFGSQRKVQIIREGKVIKEVDLFKVLVKGDTNEEAIKLIPGDIIYVPLMEKSVKILGEVKAPGIYEIKKGEKIKDLIEMAGGFTVRADLKNVTLERYITETKKIINLDLTTLFTKGDETYNIELEDGDIVNIPVRME
ncbi:MAG: polysaccharide biosynthesis protein [Dictyoglomus sp. NZ13-RE01]|nr:MAG: polysaccharide biosynthesis protein [Dictyoglomus sp. NZ13-RE01]